MVKALVECDQIVYDTILEYLLSNVLEPLPTARTQSIRHFAKHLSIWMEAALQVCPLASSSRHQCLLTEVVRAQKIRIYIFTFYVSHLYGSNIDPTYVSTLVNTFRVSRKALLPEN